MLIDHFFELAIPFVVVMVIVSKLFIMIAEKKGIYASKEGAETRDDVNKRYGVNKGGIVIGILVFLVYLLCVGEIFERTGPSGFFFSCVISVLLLLPFGTVGVMLFLVYTLIVHGHAKLKRKD